MIGLNKDLVKVIPYDKSWSLEYEKEKSVLMKILKDFKFKIEHVGSTSIPGLSAKPIIDIAIAVQTKNDLFKMITPLKIAGYDILNEFETKGDILARKGNPNLRTHYIHIQLENSNYWKEFIYFKKYLIEHPNEIKNYEDLKIELSNKFYNDRKSYTSNKNKYISSVLEKAFKLYNVKNTDA